mmetsp:Transcript_22614/g.52729  ORF Transcript_22614/g.52729 Transcript_22614/m.52729 type:complete len:224 (+) Transcript_22614:1380-2051(+)
MGSPCNTSAICRTDKAKSSCASMGFSLSAFCNPARALARSIAALMSASDGAPPSETTSALSCTPSAEAGIWALPRCCSSEETMPAVWIGAASPATGDNSGSGSAFSQASFTTSCKSAGNACLKSALDSNACRHAPTRSNTASTTATCLRNWRFRSWKAKRNLRTSSLWITLSNTLRRSSCCWLAACCIARRSLWKASRAASVAGPPPSSRTIADTAASNSFFN